MKVLLIKVLLLVVVKENTVYGWRNRPGQEDRWEWGYYEAPPSSVSMNDPRYSNWHPHRPHPFNSDRFYPHPYNPHSYNPGPYNPHSYNPSPYNPHSYNPSPYNPHSYNLSPYNQHSYNQSPNYPSNKPSFSNPSPNNPCPDHPSSDNPSPNNPSPYNPSPNNPSPDYPSPNNPSPDNPSPYNPSPYNPSPYIPSPNNPSPNNPSPYNPSPNNPSPNNPSPYNPSPNNPSPNNPSPDNPSPDNPRPDYPSSNNQSPYNPSFDYPSSNNQSPDNPSPDYPSSNNQSPYNPSPDYPSSNNQSPDISSPDYPSSNNQSPYNPISNNQSPDNPSPNNPSPDNPSSDNPSPESPNTYNSTNTLDSRDQFNNKEPEVEFQNKPTTPTPTNIVIKGPSEQFRLPDCSGDYLVNQPDFSSPSRRISEVKCYEYLWQLKNRLDKSKWEKVCDKQTFFISVIGGRNAGPGEFPHMGAIGWEGVSEPLIFLCGGTLISPKFLLTAAHCSKAPADTNLVNTIPKMVRLGYHNIANLDSSTARTSDDINIIRIINHPEFAAPKKYNDIALMELEREVKFSKTLQPACLWPSSNVQRSQEVNVTGWGLTEEKGSSGTKIMQVGTVNLLDSPTCDGQLRRFCNRLWCGVTDSQICAGKTGGGVDACRGDSGGPLQARITLPPEYDVEGWMHHVIGVTSFGIGCGRVDVPGVYTRVSRYLDWIEPIVWA